VERESKEGIEKEKNIQTIEKTNQQTKNNKKMSAKEITGRDNVLINGKLNRH
jgi:hypothetical protein